MPAWCSGGAREDQGLSAEGVRSGSARSWRGFAGWKAFMAPPRHTRGFARGVLRTHRSPAPAGEFDFPVAGYILGD